MTWERKVTVRTPPRPPHENELDVCSLCGLTPLPGRRRSWCGDDCVRLWAIATSGQAALHHLGELHGHACWDCGADWEIPERDRYHLTLQDPDPSWHPRGWGAHSRLHVVHGPPSPRPVALNVDHIRPLWSLTDHERLELRWWLPFNLQLLCETCHKAKTKREAAARARMRRLGQTGPPALEAHDQLELGAAS